MRKVYLAGPMRGYPEFNFPAFAKATDNLRGQGYTVFSPAEKDEEVHGADFSEKYETGDIEAATKDGFSLRDALKTDLSWICDNADMIALLPGWDMSKGAQAEYALALALGLDVLLLGEDK